MITCERFEYLQADGWTLSYIAGEDTGGPCGKQVKPGSIIALVTTHARCSYYKGDCGRCLDESANPESHNPPCMEDLDIALEELDEIEDSLVSWCEQQEGERLKFLHQHPMSAAAPDLLAACEQARDEILLGVRSGTLKVGSGWLLKQLDDAISKAKGEP